MKQIRISRTNRTARRPIADAPSPLPVSPPSTTAGATALVGRIDRLLNGR